MVGVVEGVEELAEQVARAGVAVRLEDHDQPPPEALARRRQGGADLGRVVAVVADHHDAAGLAAELEAAVDAAELAERLAGGLERHPELARRRRCAATALSA